MPGPNAYIPQSLIQPLTTVVQPGDITRRIIPGYQVPTLYDGCLARDTLLWENSIAHGGLQKLCCPQGRPKYDSKPWISMPSGARKFKPIANILASSILPYDGTDKLVLSERVPLGYDGVITDIVCELVATAGTGFAEGSGDVSWRLEADKRFLRDLGNLQVTIGSLVYPSPTPRGGIRVYSHNLLEFYVAIAAGAPINPNARVVCSISGWYWPR